MISDVTLWLVYSLLPAVSGNILNVLGSSLCGHRCYMLYLWLGLQPLCDVIANSILQISDVREAGQVVIYIAARRHFLMYKTVQ